LESVTADACVGDAVDITINSCRSVVCPWAVAPWPGKHPLSPNAKAIEVAVCAVTPVDAATTGPTNPVAVSVTEPAVVIF